jgi:hypothetical protein
LTEWKVYLHGKCIDSVFYDSDFTADEVRSSLINHDGYDNRIVVKKAKKDGFFGTLDMGSIEI